MYTVIVLVTPTPSRTSPAIYTYIYIYIERANDTHMCLVLFGLFLV